MTVPGPGLVDALQFPVILWHRNVGDAHAAGASAPKSVRNIPVIHLQNYFQNSGIFSWRFLIFFVLPAFRRDDMPPHRYGALMVFFSILQLRGSIIEPKASLKYLIQNIFLLFT